jgi:phytoene dehydrogenase-like protein
MPKSIIIIGAGIAGLSAGCFGQMNGYQTQIFELHDLPGGLCTAWKRKGYTIDGCIHWLMGTNPTSDLNTLWRQLGALPGQGVINHEEFERVQDADGKTLIVYADADRLEAQMKELAPGDAAAIEEFTKTIRRFSRTSMIADKPRELMGPIDGLKSGLKMLPYLGDFKRGMSTTAGEYALRFKDPFLRRVFLLIYGAADLPMIVYFMFLGSLHAQDSGVPRGGSLAFAQAIERRYRNLGGQIHYRARVAKILVEDDPAGGPRRGGSHAVGVRLVDGREFRADYVISAADGHSTLWNMLDGKFLTDQFRALYAKRRIFSPVVQVSLGVACDLSATPHAGTIMLKEPVTIAGKARESIGYRHLSYDPSMAPLGKSLLEVMLDSNHAYWQEIAKDQERYDAEKQQIAIKVMELLEPQFPGITDAVEMVDVATPLTTERYTANWQGSTEGWYVSRDSADLMTKGIAKTLPGLNNFYMAGQWVEPGGGLPGVAPSGRNIIQMICRRDKVKFVTSEP